MNATPVTLHPTLRFRPEDVHHEDIPAVIRELNAAGFSNYDLGEILKVRESTIRNWALAHSEPRYRKASVLIAMWKTYCPSAQHEPS